MYILFYYSKCQGIGIGIGGGKDMDDYMFRSYVTEFKCVQEETSYLEIFNYSVSWLPWFLGLRWSCY